MRQNCNFDPEVLDDIYDSVGIETQHEDIHHIASGDGRDVYALGTECVAKIPHNDWGEIHTLNEIDTWKSVKGTEFEHYLAEIVDDAGREWVVMERADRLPDKETVSQIDQEMMSSGIQCADVTRRNFGVVDGKVKMIDYGGGCKIR